MSLVDDIAFQKLDEFYHGYKMTHVDNPDYTIDYIMMIFIELPKFRPETIKDKYRDAVSRARTVKRERV